MTIDELTEAERKWLDEQLRAAQELVAGIAGRSSITVEDLQTTWDAWIVDGDTDGTRVNTVINALGIAFGQNLAVGGQLRWVIATDEQGSDLALHAFPGTGDVLIYPANLLAKRWQTRESRFIVGLFHEILKQVAGFAPQAPEKKKPWWKLG